MASLLKYCHGFFWFKSQDIYWIVLAAGEIEDYPQDLICHLYFIEKRAIQGDHAILQQHSLLDVSSKLLIIPVALFPLSGF
jgi:hypothetical protein